jgi:hypothetical protein
MRDLQRDTEFEEFVLAQRSALVRMARLLTPATTHSPRTSYRSP